MSNKLSISRLMREQQKMQQNPNKQFVVVPSSENIFEWHFVLYNFEDSPYQGGQFHGKLLIPPDYPMKPPTLIFVTPQGRFKPGEKICLSFTSFHPESWSTSWTIETMLIALISFMHTNENTAGGINTSNEEKKRLANASIRTNLMDLQFEKIFKPYYERLGIQKGELQLVFEKQNSNNDQRNPMINTNQHHLIDQNDDQVINWKKIIAFLTIAFFLIALYGYRKNKQ